MDDNLSSDNSVEPGQGPGRGMTGTGAASANREPPGGDEHPSPPQADEVGSSLMGWKTFNDRLALAILAGVPLLWAATQWVAIPAEAVGATIAVWTMVAQFYFRKKATAHGRGQREGEA